MVSDTNFPKLTYAGHLGSRKMVSDTNFYLLGSTKLVSDTIFYLPPKTVQGKRS
jgi:hypothetical protein